MSDDHRFTISTPEELNIMLKDENLIKEFCNYLVFDKMSQPEAWIKTFRVDSPMSDSHNTKMYRWLKKDIVQKWKTKANKSLEVDWIDKKVNIMERMYRISMNELNDAGGTKIEVPLKLQADTGKDWLDAVKADKTINLNLNESSTVNIVQIVQDKLNLITEGATIQPDFLVAPKNKDAIDVVVEKDKING